MKDANHRDPSSYVGDGLTIAAVVAMVVCCATPLLIGAGLVTSAGVLLRNVGIVAIGLALVGWPVLRAMRRLHNQQQLGSVDPERRDATPTRPPEN